jgi:hypothetical protein
MIPDVPLVVSEDSLNDLDDRAGFGPEAALLLDFTDGGVLQGLAETDFAAGDAPQPGVGISGALDEENRIALQDDGAYGEDGR